MKLNVYGRKVEVVKISNNWVVYYLGNEGKKRTAYDIMIPDDLKENGNYSASKETFEATMNAGHLPSNSRRNASVAVTLCFLQVVK